MNPRLFFVFEENEFEEIEEIEEEYDARFISGYTKPGKQLYLMQSLED